MLKKIRVKNFKGFKDWMEIDFSKVKDYDFNQELITERTPNKIIIYGKNASGKSNIGLAIFDIISNLTDKNKNHKEYQNYLNCETEEEYVFFEYTFIFNEIEVVYKYQKLDFETIVKEELYIDGIKVIFIDKKLSENFDSLLEGTQTLNKNFNGMEISVVKYIANNSKLEDNKINNTFKSFMKFVDSMLYIRGLNYNTYIGFSNGSSMILAEIINSGKLQEFEKFLNSAGVKCRLVEMSIDGQKTIGYSFGSKIKSFNEISSTGTLALALYYFWLIKIENVSLFMIDEFDAFLHFELAKRIVKMLKKLTCQIILTTHNPTLMSNELLRPDCYFVIKNNCEFKSLPFLTSKELRVVHDLEKIYRAHGFED